MKKEGRMPFYRVVIFLMLAIVGVFSMFIASYQVAVDWIDIYYTGYYTKNVKIAYVSALAQDDAPTVEVDFDEIGGKAENAIINRYISTKYRGDDYIEERGNRVNEEINNNADNIEENELKEKLYSGNKNDEYENWNYKP